MQEKENKSNNIYLTIIDVKNQKIEHSTSKILIKSENGSYEIHFGHIETFLPLVNASIHIYDGKTEIKKIETTNGIFFFKENISKIIIDI
jgi:hypothetical protein